MNPASLPCLPCPVSAPTPLPSRPSPLTRTNKTTHTSRPGCHHRIHAALPARSVATRLQVQSHALTALHQHQHHHHHRSRQQDAGKAHSGVGSSLRQPYRGTVDALRRVLREEGLRRGWYAGLGAVLSQTVVSNFFYFLWYDTVKRAYAALKRDIKPASTAMELFLGALAGALSRIITTPISVVTVR
ncbi:ADP/ATP carrier protein, partial [Cladochytrium tenue]